VKVASSPLSFLQRAALLGSTVGLVLIAPDFAAASPIASFTFSPGSPLTGETVTLTSTSTGGAETWDLDGDGECDDDSGAVVTVSYETAGSYFVKLCVSDGVNEASQQQQVTIRNRPPLASFMFAPAAPVAGDPVTVTSTSVDPDGPLTALQWDLDGDGRFDDAAGITAAVTYPTPGTYTVRLLVTDRDGASSTALQTVAVAKRPPALLSPFPVVRIIGAVGPRGTRIKALVVKAPAGSKVRIRCRGRGCPFRRLTRSIRRSKPLRIYRLRRHTLRPRAAIEVWVTKPDTIGKYARFRIRRGKAPLRVDRCALPGALRSRACPSSASV
jgi:PKD repeat protein